ncbi:MAG: hypothetical protein CMA63_00505 [Euryarchaeota archaeon]|nr:hypothetical protein [Euryarchaeota archaeon]
MTSVSISDWEHVCETFASFFRGIGEVQIDSNQAHFNSFSDDVQTSLGLFQSGAFAAAMPLHGIESSIDTVVFDGEANEVRLLGPSVNYTYRVPPQLLSHRGE